MVEPAHRLWQEAFGAARDSAKVGSDSIFSQALVADSCRLAKLISLVESGQAWLEQITEQMCHMSYEEQARHLGGPISLLKAFATRTTHEVRDASIGPESVVC